MGLNFFIWWNDGVKYLLNLIFLNYREMVSIAHRLTTYVYLFRSLDWRRLDIWEVMSPWVMVELANTERVQVVEVKLVVCITRESWWTNCKCQKECLISIFSHPGYYGKLGMRVFHLQRNWKHCPTVNTDKLWSLVSEATRKAAEKSKDKAPVIDVTKSVSPSFQFYFLFAILINKIIK